MTVVLVHGAWHGAWCWERVLAELGRRGVATLAVDLPGHGADRGPLGDLHDDAARVRAVLDEVAGPVVLVGHSYGGAVITEAGEHPGVAHLVYLCAFALDAGESCATAGVGEGGAARISHEGRPHLGAGFVRSPDGTVTLAPDVAGECLYNDCDAETVAWALARLGPQPIATLRQEPRAVSWRTRPSTYVVCADDLAIHPDLQRLLARRCTTSFEWQSGHSPFLSRPELVAGLLEELVASYPTSG